MIEDELADAHQDLERAGGDPQSRIQRMVDEYNASEQSSGGQLDLSIVGRQGSSDGCRFPIHFSRARGPWYALHSIVGRLGQEERAASRFGRCFFRNARQARTATGRGAIATEEKIGRRGRRKRRAGGNSASKPILRLQSNQRRNFFLQVADRVAEKNVRPGQPHPQSAGPRGSLRAVGRAGRHAPPRSAA